MEFVVLEEETEPVSTTNELQKLSLMNSTTTNGHTNHFTLPTTTTTAKSSFIPSYPPNPSTTNTSIPNNNISSNENFSSNFWLPNPPPVVNDQISESYESISIPSQPTSINDAFNSNLNALVQSNNPTNPFSPYGYSMAAQAQSPNINHRQPTIFTPKRGTNPFDDDLIRR